MLTFDNIGGEVIMAIVLYEGGKKVGDLEDWKIIETPAQYKDVLGKKVLSSKSANQCSFTSPKPLKRKGQYSVVENQKTEFVLQMKELKNRTLVTALILEKKPLK